MGSCVLLHKTPRPGHHSQCDFILLQLEHGDEGRVVHAHCCGSVHRHYLITAPGENHKHHQREVWCVKSDDRIQELITSYGSQIGLNLLEASVKVSRCSRHDGFDEERLLAVALLIAPHDAEAPALVVGLLQDDVPAPVHVTATTRAASELALSHKDEQNT